MWRCAFSCLLFGVLVSPQSDVSLSTLGLEKDEVPTYSSTGLRPLLNANNIEVDTVFVTEGAFAENGIFFAFKAFWTTDRPIKVQIWRPSSTNQDNAHDQNMTFIADVTITPEQTNVTQTIYIVSSLDQKCIRTQKGDRIGFQVKAGTTSSFPIVYDETRENTGIFMATANVENMVGQSQLNFSRRMFPYKMNFIAYLVVDNVHAGGDPKAECPRSLAVESVVVTTPAMVPGDTGPTGDTGPAGDPGEPGPVGVRGPTGPPGHQGGTGSPGKTGPTGATGWTGDIGHIGDQGATGDEGPEGDSGDPGMRGDTGPPGPNGMDGRLIIGNKTDNSSLFASLVDDLATWSEDGEPWKSERYMIGLLIWLSLLSLLCVVFLIAVGCLCSRLRKVAKGTSDMWKTLGSSTTPRTSLSVESGVGMTKNGDPATFGETVGTDTLRICESDENIRALREDTFQEFSYETIPGT